MNGDPGQEEVERPLFPRAIALPFLVVTFIGGFSAFVGRVLSGLMSGGYFDFSDIGWLMSGSFYAFFVPIHLWVDAALVHRRSKRAFRTLGAALGAALGFSFNCVLFATAGAFVAGVWAFGLWAAFGRSHPRAQDIIQAIAIIAIAVGTLTGAVASVWCRRQLSVALRAPAQTPLNRSED